MIPHPPIEQESHPAAARGLGRILVATDFSPRSECALGRATHLPLRPGAEAVVLHVLPAPHSGDADEREATVLAGHALRQAAHRVGGRHGRAELRARSLLREGAPVAQLEAAAKEL
ncbi:universal stress protein, partial [Pyxidicoccus sp. 3LG]